ncbi:hypothetical protein EVAR_100694_1 [Eumeta japonica]|uniref:Uncharacterized protein n=1 Tax=Eumeta variegata TaxID=151549 RepID=A0A4C1T1X8_EUMVA|nr:hypothetical protein EVAR_100694_1 [Eumeta japonica]
MLQKGVWKFKRLGWDSDTYDFDEKDDMEINSPPVQLRRYKRIQGRHNSQTVNTHLNETLQTVHMYVQLNGEANPTTAAAVQDEQHVPADQAAVPASQQTQRSA